MKLGTEVYNQKGEKINNFSPLEDRFWSQVNKDGKEHSLLGKCWEWTGLPQRSGYCRIRSKLKFIRVHQYSWTLHKGKIPSGLNVCHHCDNKICVNPDHLFLGTHVDNQADKVAKGRQARGEEIDVSKLTEKQVKQIRKLYTKGSHTFGYRGLARNFEVSDSLIEAIIKRRCWKHI